MWVESRIRGSRNLSQIYPREYNYLAKGRSPGEDYGLSIGYMTESLDQFYVILKVLAVLVDTWITASFSIYVYICLSSILFVCVVPHLLHVPWVHPRAHVCTQPHSIHLVFHTSLLFTVLISLWTCIFRSSSAWGILTHGTQLKVERIFYCLQAEFIFHFSVPVQRSVLVARVRLQGLTREVSAGFPCLWGDVVSL